MYLPDTYTGSRPSGMSQLLLQTELAGLDMHKSCLMGTELEITYDLWLLFYQRILTSKKRNTWLNFILLISFLILKSQ